MPVERRGQLLSLLIERKKKFKLANGRPVELALWRQLVVIWNSDCLNATSSIALGLGCGVGLHLISTVEAAASVARCRPAEQAARLAIYITCIGFPWIQYALFSFLSFKHLSQGALFDG